MMDRSIAMESSFSKNSSGISNSTKSKLQKLEEKKNKWKKKDKDQKVVPKSSESESDNCEKIERP